jgi:hypothetical protein
VKTSSDYRDLLFEFNAAKVRFLIVGAYAVMFHTEPRYTKDLDVWVEPTRKNARSVRTALENFGAPLDNLSVDDLIQPDLVFQIGIEPIRIDILTHVEGLTFRQAYERAARTMYADVPVRLLSAEDALRAKLAVGRPQDLLDADKLQRLLGRAKTQGTSRHKGRTSKLKR